MTAQTLTVEGSIATHLSTRRRMLGGAALGGVALAASACDAGRPLGGDTARAGQRAAGEELRMAMRKLWEDHILYTRNFIISALAELADLPTVTQRLLRNQDDIGDAIKPYYGDAAGDQLAQLLRDHILVAADIVTAAKEGDSATVAAKQEAWSANSRAIAAFLSGANPNWPQAGLETMLQWHLDLTTGEIVARLGEDWSADIRSFDAGHEHMLIFADALATGVVAQFPDRFA